MRKALVVGINYYERAVHLHGCVSDAYAIHQVLDCNVDGSINFDTFLMTAVDEHTAIDRRELKSAVRQLFSDDADIALFYFAGYGYVENNVGYLVTSDCNSGGSGLPLDEVLNIANESKARNKLLVLDCCQSGAAGTARPFGEKTLLSEGMTILAAFSKDRYAQERNGSGLMTRLFVDAMNGAATNLVGDITQCSVYAYIDQSLGLWEQRPIFKTNVKTVTSLRKVTPPHPTRRCDAV